MNKKLEAIKVLITRLEEVEITIEIVGDSKANYVYISLDNGTSLRSAILRGVMEYESYPRRRA